VHIEPQVFDVLVHLIKCRDRVVGKDELFRAVWRGRIVSEDTLTSRISAARRAIGDSGARQSRLRTIPRRGFRFCGEVEERAPTPAATAAENTPAHSRQAPLSNLPNETTRLIGRDEEAAEIARLLSTARLVTLTGVGGVGKTRLAQRVASTVAPNYPDGAWLVELAPVTDPAALGHAVAGVLGVAQHAGKSIAQSVVQSLSRRRLLLVLDNCEHLIDAVAMLAHDILANCAQVTVLATSREALMVGGERTSPVPPLRTGDGVASPAVELFLERARAVAPDFEVDDEGLAVSEICRRLEGIPLGIELAAARTRAMMASEIRDRLDRIVPLLTGGLRGAAERHRTLHAAVQWSYELLPTVEQAVGAHGGKEAPMLRITFTIEVNLERLRALTAFLG
jgi:DNA-binding winged helix-turn-helix (wHTH) protein